MTTPPSPRPEDDSVVLAQPTVDMPAIPLTPSANIPNAEDPLTQEAQDLPSKGDKIPQDPPASWTLPFSFLLIINSI